MQAAVVKGFGGVENLAIENVSVPQVNPGQVLVKVHCAGVNFEDTLIRSGNHPNLPQVPYVTGLEGSGVVQQIGPNVDYLKEGDKVWFAKPITGSIAEYCLTSAELTFPLPNNVSFEQGASLGVAFITAYRALFVKAGAQASHTILIHGISRSVGLAACQIAKIHGLHVVGTAGSDKGKELALNCGAEAVFNHKEPNYIETIKTQYPNGFNIVLEMRGNVNLNTDFNLITKYGKIVLIGNCGDVSINPNNLINNESTIVGVCSSIGDNSDYQRIAERINGLLSGGHISPYINQILPLDDIVSVHQMLESSNSRQGKIVIGIDSSIHSQHSTPTIDNNPPNVEQPSDINSNMPQEPNDKIEVDPLPTPNPTDTEPGPTTIEIDPNPEEKPDNSQVDVQLPNQPEPQTSSDNEFDGMQYGDFVKLDD